MSMDEYANLPRRQREILSAIVRQYISDSTPVGSKVLAGVSPEQLSSATIRSCMAELEEAGFLEQPHVSAGRIPTDKAYRYYVDHLMVPERLEVETERYIEAALAMEGGGDPGRLMEKTSQVLARISHSVGLALGQSLEDRILEHIKFVKLPEHRILAVIVSNPDLVENRVVRVEEEISQEELDRTADYMNGEFRGWSLGTIRLEILKRIEAMKAICDRLISNVARLVVWGALANDETCPVFVEGAAAILDQPEFEDARKLRDLLHTLEEKSKLVKILNGCLHSPGRGVKILIGRENPTSEMYNCTLVLAPVFYRDRLAGALGVVGPRRMQYDRAVRAVAYVSDVCTRILNTN